MKLFKYRDLSNADPSTYQKLRQIITGPTIWCSRPEPLNDPDEFSFSCDFTHSPRTAKLLAHLLTALRRFHPDNANEAAEKILLSGGLEEIAQPIILEIVKKCRNTLGVACFGASSSNPILWKRYGGNGNGVCIEIDIPDPAVIGRISKVEYTSKRIIHIDIFLDHQRLGESYKAILLTKTDFWSPEAEFRFISKKPDVLLTLENSRTSRIILGEALESRSALEIIKIAAENHPKPVIELRGS